MQISQKAESVLPSHSSLFQALPKLLLSDTHEEQGVRLAVGRALGHTVGSRRAASACLHL